jgi:hypothetical protein
MVPLYGASLVLLFSLALFAYQNRRIGWVKPKRVALEVASEDLPLPAAIASSDFANFTLQLARLQKSLAATKPVPDRERVTV